MHITFTFTFADAAVPAQTSALSLRSYTNIKQNFRKVTPTHVINPGPAVDS